MKSKKQQFKMMDKEAMASQLKSESSDYKAAQKPDTNQGWLHSGVNQLTYNSYTGIQKKPTAVGNKLVN